MRFSRIFLLSWTLLSAITAAVPDLAYWQSRDSNYNSDVGTGGFQGPGDIASGAIAFYSCGRAYNAAYAIANGAACDIVDTATGLASCTIPIDDDGFANLLDVVCPTAAPVVNVVTFCTVTHVGCSVSKMYDQTGTGNHVVQATLANMPRLTFSAQNGLPCPAGTNNAAVALISAGNISPALPVTFTSVFDITGSFTTNQRLWAAGAQQRHSTTNTLATSNGTSVPLTVADSAFHAALSVFSATAPLIAVDSSANTSTSTTGTNAINNLVTFMNFSTPTTGLLAGFECEMGIWPADLNSSYQAMLANMRSATNGWNF